MALHSQYSFSFKLLQHYKSNKLIEDVDWAESPAFYVLLKEQISGVLQGAQGDAAVGDKALPEDE